MHSELPSAEAKVFYRLYNTVFGKLVLETHLAIKSWCELIIRAPSEVIRLGASTPPHESSMVNQKKVENSCRHFGCFQARFQGNALPLQWCSSGTAR